MSKRLLLILCAVSWSTLCSAEPTASPELRAYASGVRDAVHARPLTLHRLDIAVDLRGVVSETTVEATFANPTKETLEGDYRFLLPPGAVVTGYALDVDGRMIDGVLVDRPRARAVYNERVRRGVDPGVAEVTPDHLLRTVVNPILPGRSRTIRIRFALPIPRDGYRLPLSIDAPTGGWSLRLRATQVDRPPLVQLGGGRPVAWQADANGHVARIDGGPTKFPGALSIARPATPDLVVSTHRSGEDDLQVGGPLRRQRAAAVGRLRIYWDRSRARLASDPVADLDFVERAIARLHPTSIELVAFNSSGASRATVSDAAAARRWLSDIRHRGTTGYASLVGESPADRCLLFVNGGPGIDRGTHFEPRCRTDVVSSSPLADRPYLRHLAREHGGELFEPAMGHNAALMSTLDALRPGIVAVSDRDGRALPFLPLEASPGRWLVLVKAPPTGPVLVHFEGSDDAERIPLTTAGQPFDATGALVASERLAALTATEDRGAYVDLSRRYGIASPSLSFLVLETPTDYVVARVDPPASFPADLRDAYQRTIKGNAARRAEERQRWADTVANRWAETVSWWERRYDPNARPPVRLAPPAVQYDSAATPTQSQSLSAIAPAPGAPPAPPPAPMLRRAEEVEGRADSRNKTAGRTPDLAAASRIEIDAWQPGRPYLALYDSRPADFDASFLEAERRHGQLPIFYLDTAEWLRRHDRAADAMDMVLSALDLPTANEVTLGVVADRLERYGQIDRAIELRERQAVLDPDRPQPRRLLALALARRASSRGPSEKADLTRAIGLLYAVATEPLGGPWDGIETIALVEANALLPRLQQLGGTVAMEPRFVRLLDVDLRVVIDWTTDGSDMDLWVDEPNGERAIYSNPRTLIGGHLSRDMTRGYGPEEYLLHRAPGGAYVVQANVFAPDRLDPNGATILTAHLFRHFGRADQQEESIDVEVTKDDQGAKRIGRLTVGAAKD